MTRPIADRSFAVGMGRNAENCRLRRANLGVARDCLAQLRSQRPGSVDLFGRTVEQLEYTIAFQERSLRIAESA